jgi:hypothetical protein
MKKLLLLLWLFVALFVSAYGQKELDSCYSRIDSYYKNNDNAEGKDKLIHVIYLLETFLPEIQVDSSAIISYNYISDYIGEEFSITAIASDYVYTLYSKETKFSKVVTQKRKKIKSKLYHVIVNSITPIENIKNRYSFVNASQNNKDLYAQIFITNHKIYYCYFGFANFPFKIDLQYMKKSSRFRINIIGENIGKLKII